MQYRFDEFEVDTENYELRKNGDAQHVEPLIFDLICYFSRNAGRVLDRGEIIDNVWSGRFVSDATVSSGIKSARKALGDDGDRQTYIRTIRGRGFQFVGDVQSSQEVIPSSPESLRKSPSDGYSPSLVIMPFQILCDNPKLGGLGAGLVENLKTVLTRVPFLKIAAHQSENSNDTNYRLEGSIQELTNDILINLKLIESKNGFHLWAQQFNQAGNKDTLIKLLDQCLPQLETQLVRAIFNDLQSESDELSARQLVIKATTMLSLKGWNKQSFMESADLLRRSIKLEPNLALSHGYLALILGLGHRVGLLQKSTRIINEAIDEADKALELDNMDSNVLGLAGCALADVGHTSRAIPILIKATELNPNNAQAFAGLGSAYLIAGNAEAAIKNVEHGIKISPADNRLAIWWSVLAFAYLKQGDLEKASRAAQNACQSDDRTYIPQVVLAVVHIANKNDAQAAISIRECYRLNPDLSPEQIITLVGKKSSKAFEKMKADLGE